MPKKILLADDSITIQKVVELTFSDGDYEVSAVNNGAKAIQRLGEMRPDIILSDIIMPERNGYEVCEYVKSHPEFRTIPVILLTGTFEPFDPDRADKAGCDAVVTKPFVFNQLFDFVNQALRLEWFGHDGIASGFVGTVGIKRLKGSCQQNDRNGSEFGVRFHVLTDFVAVLLGHDDVREDDVRPHVRELLDRLVAVIDRGDLVIAV